MSLLKAVVVLLALLSPLPREPRAPAPDQLALWRAQIRHALYIPDQLPAPEPRVWSTFAPTPGVLADRITYRTAAGMMVPAVVYRPQHPRGKIPALVIVNGHGGDKYSWYAFYSGILFAQAGAEVLTYDPIGEGERNLDRKSRAGSHDVYPPTPSGQQEAGFRQQWGQRLAGLMQVDLMQAVSYLSARPEVDPGRIAVLGYSMGAFVAGIDGALDPRIHAVLLSGGGTFDDAADPGKPYDLGTLPCQAPPWLALKVLGPEPHARGAILYALNAARGPTLVENGSADTVMGIPDRPPAWFDALRAQAATLLSDRGLSTANLFTTHVDPGKSHRTAWVERPAILWLDAQLHFPNWTAAQITTMPSTHISTWALANHVDITPNYLREDREGGLDALNPFAHNPAAPGQAIPALSRAQLTVLPTPDWQHLAPHLIFESWATKTLAEMQFRHYPR